MKTLDPRYIPILEEKYGRYWWPVEYPEETSKDPFKNLIITVLSQNTSEINCVRAYKGLAAKFEVKPEVLAKAKTEEIKTAIKSGGLYNVKSKRIKELSQAVLEKFRGEISPVLNLPKEEAREKLMELPGIGKKTADVLLAQRHSYAEVMVVDTHMERMRKGWAWLNKTQNMRKFRMPLKHSYHGRKEKERAACYGYWQNIVAERRTQNARNAHSSNYATTEANVRRKADESCTW